MKKFLLFLILFFTVSINTAVFGQDINQNDQNINIKLTPLNHTTFLDMPVISSFSIGYVPTNGSNSELLSQIYVFDKTTFFKNNNLEDYNKSIFTSDNLVYLEIPNMSSKLKYTASTIDNLLYYNILSEMEYIFINSTDLISTNSTSSPELKINNSINLKITPLDVKEFSQIPLTNSYSISYVPTIKNQSEELIAKIYITNTSNISNSVKFNWLKITENKGLIVAPVALNASKYANNQTNKDNYTFILNFFNDFFKNSQINAKNNSIFFDNILSGINYKLIDEKIYIPIRPVAEYLGYELQWNNDEKKIFFYKDAVFGSFAVGSEEYNSNGEIISLTPSISSNGATYVPVEFFTKILGLNYTLGNDIILFN